MPMIFHIFFTIFFIFLTLEGSNDAENLFQATLFDEAIVQFSSSDDPKKMIQALFVTENYRKIIALAKGRFFDPDTNYLIGLSLEREGDFAEAIPYFANTCPIHWTRCLLLTNRSEETPLLTLLNLIEQERWKEAKVLLDSQAIAGDSYHLLAALIAENEQDFLQALIHYQKVSASDVSGHIARCVEALTLNPILDALYAHHLQQQGKLQEAESAWHHLATKYPDNAIAPLAWIAAARLSHNPKQHFQTLYTLYPSSPYAPEAYFSSYSFQEYVEGDRNAYKHLRAMPTLFPNSPYTLFAFYLLGLDEKRDRKSDKNKWLAHRNLGNALKYFAEVEHRFEAIVIPEHLKESLEQLRITTLFEKGLTHLANAEEATDPKATIQRGYARKCFQQIANQNEEALFWLAKTEYQL
ncbi:MAG: hypothetical protein KDK65_02875, partial [Chlamydiia bacterium]|nr:hypothetical protein [Chlamydiia bacterium]